MRGSGYGRAGRFGLALIPAPLLSACGGIQSALDPAGHEAERLYGLFVGMVAGGAVIFVAVIGLLIYAAQHEERRRVHSEDAASRLILWGTLGTVAILAVLLTFSLWMWPGLRPLTLAGNEPERLRIEVTGEQFWWRVSYHTPDGAPVVAAANEIRLPVGERVDFVLNSADMIHSFWIPALGGKMDMIPGRTTSLSLEADRTGTFRAPCAEYCGTSHALMAFSVVTMEPAAFETWLAERREPSPGAQAPGLEVFLRQGCNACHAVAGTAASGEIGPDLSHIGSRETIGAGILPNDEASIARFIREVEHIKPGARMPAYPMLADADVVAIARYLKGLQ
jgi:cytochrome c oxidase subunit II